MIADADRFHAERQQRMADRLRRYDRRHPRPAPRPYRRRRGVVVVSIAMAVMAGLWVTFSG